MKRRTTHFYDVQNSRGSKTGKRYFKQCEVKAFGSNKHCYDVQNNKGGKVGKRVTPTSEKA